MLVFALLALFLQLHPACSVGFGIPIAFLGAVAVMPALGASINVISIFAFVLVLGIVVDDAIGYRLSEKAGVQIRGILYPSSRTDGGTGLVLFVAHEEIARPWSAPAPFRLLPELTHTIPVDTSPSGLVSG